MMGTGRNRQRGMGVFGIVLIIAALLITLIFAMKIVPTYLHNMQIEHILTAIVNDPEMRNASVKDIRISYSKRATMDSITDVTQEDIEVNKEGGGLTLSATYTVKIPLVGNASLVLDFNPRSSK